MSYYGKLCTIIYDLDKPFAAGDELVLYTTHIASKQARILEPMCGSGRFYIPLLKEGYNVTGYDLSREMLNACLKKCTALKIVPKIFKADITTYKSEEKFDFIFIPIGSVSLLIQEQDLLQSFLNIFTCLDKAGVFIFSFLNPRARVENITQWKETMCYPLVGKEIKCKQKLIYQESIQILDIELLYEMIQNDIVIETEYQDFPLKLYTENYMRRILKQAGFEHIRVIKGQESDSQFSVIHCIKP